MNAYSFAYTHQLRMRVRIPTYVQPNWKIQTHCCTKEGSRLNQMKSIPKCNLNSPWLPVGAIYDPSRGYSVPKSWNSWCSVYRLSCSSFCLSCHDFGPLKVTYGTRKWAMKASMPRMAGYCVSMRTRDREKSQNTRGTEEKKTILVKAL